ncbi:MAG: phosphatase PAP2 family protein [Polaromonas sp.]|nr:phosphatase PAP2 family protein [Polaromonas sp.]
MTASDPAAALVSWLGAHALGLYGALLLLLLALAVLAWWLTQRYAVPRANSTWSGVTFLLIRLAAGFAVLVGAAAVFAGIAEALGDGERVGELDQLFSDAVRDSTPQAVLHVFAALTRLADTPTLAVLLVAGAVTLFLFRRRWLALGWMLALGGNAVLNTTLKAVFERTRPVHDTALIHAQGWSFPSGHSSGSVVAYGMLAYVLVRTLPPKLAWQASLPLVLAAVATAFTVGSSRVFLQVHFATDVLAGFASGSAWLAVCIASHEWTRHYRHRRGSAQAAT